MTGEVKVVIPSHKRWNAVPALQAIEHAILCVSESQEPAYRKCNPEAEIVTHPDSIVGLRPKRAWICRHFGDCIQIDDDVRYMMRVYEASGPRIKSPALAWEIIQSTAYTARELGAYLFGFAQRPDPKTFRSHMPIATTGIVMGCAVGVLAGTEGCKLDFDLWPEPMHQDWFISLLNAHHHRVAFFDNRFGFARGPTMGARGGCAEFRTMERSAQVVGKLQHYFGRDIVRPRAGKKGGFKTQIHEHQFTVKLPF